jgi:hypothetical protein
MTSGEGKAYPEPNSDVADLEQLTSVVEAHDAGGFGVDSLMGLSLHRSRSLHLESLSHAR